ncbi:MAG: hypothetical protein IKQ68_08080 [Prevotella sp.]|nr:hypothetical protein [Prevotella sp.]
MKKTLHYMLMLLMMAVMTLSTQTARAEEIDLNDVDGVSYALLGKWTTDPATLLKDLPADVKDASCLLTFSKDYSFNLTVMLNGSAEQIDIEMKLVIDGVWNYEKGGKLKVDDLKPHLEVTDLKIPSDMMKQLALLGQTEASVKQMFNKMLNEKAQDYMNKEELMKLNELNILSLTETTMTVDNDSEKVVFTKVTE